jgi:two-component system, OmpR family, KDP operon response regulator KdpE
MTSTSPLILIIEDEAPIRRFLRATLADGGYRFNEAETGQEGLKLAASQPPDLVLLDLGLPDVDGLQIVRQLRDWTSVPVIILSARGQENDKVLALDAGADDYLTKPFGVGELLARIRVALRHAAKGANEKGDAAFQVGDLKIDFATRRVSANGEEVHLTPIEYRLLTTLARHAGKVLTHRFLLKEVWGPDQVYENHYLRVFMTTLRRKIEADPARPRYLLTEQGVGYRLADV